jgi:hypothetical protein
VGYIGLIEDCNGYLYHHTTKIEKIMECLLGKMDSDLQEMKAGQEAMKARIQANQRRL